MRNELSKLSSMVLIKLISGEQNRDALAELLGKRKLFVCSGVLYPFHEFIRIQHERGFPSIQKLDPEIQLPEKIDFTYNHIISKFSSFKPENLSHDLKGPFCDAQYKRLYSHLELRIGDPEINSLKTEFESSQSLTRMIYNHIKYSWLEACRYYDPNYVRYRWRRQGQIIELIRPRVVEVGNFRKWLENEFPNKGHLPQKQISEMREKIRNHFGYFEDNPRNISEESAEDPIEESVQKNLSHNLFHDVAFEKQTNIQKQRPTIRVLGEKKLFALCIEILENYTLKGFSFSKLAEQYGLSKTALSRFAGTEWTKETSEGSVSDLWQNMAKVILSDPLFTDAATSLAILPQLKGIIDSSGKNG